MTTSETVRHRLLAAGIRPTDLATALHVSRPAASMMLDAKGTGTRRGIPSKHFDAIAALLGISRAELVTLPKTKERNRPIRDSNEALHSVVLPNADALAIPADLIPPSCPPDVAAVAGRIISHAYHLLAYAETLIAGHSGDSKDQQPNRFIASRGGRTPSRTAVGRK
jgi:hypothetical protein